MGLPWYEIVPAEAPLDQGDLIYHCPVVSWKAEPVHVSDTSEAVGMLQGTLDIAQVDVVVMTQTCDLEQRKVHYVILCPHYSLETYRQSWEADQLAHGQHPTAKSWGRFLDRVVAGQVWNLSMLNREDRVDDAAGLRIVDFHEVFSLPRDFLESWLKQEGRSRWRLCPPYREHLSQAFARFFMRVGLPTDIQKTW